MNIPGPGQDLFLFVRHWSRRSTLSSQKLAEQGQLVRITEAVHTLSRQGIAPTVNAVAHELGIDQSGASRLIKNASDAGYLSMQAPETDGRRRQATVTSSGHDMLAQAHEWQEQIFDRLTQDWSQQQRHDFQRAMADLIERSYTLDE